MHSGQLDPVDYVDEDLVREVIEYEEKYKRRSVWKKKPYPTRRDLARAVVEAASMFYGHPDDFPRFVLDILESKGFDVRHVTVKRIWGVYEELVRRRVIGDRLGVVVS